MKNYPNKYHILFAFIVLLLVIVKDRRDLKWWNKQEEFSSYGSIDLVVNYCYVNRNDLSFNDSIKANSYTFELIDTIIQDFDWISIETPFRLVKEPDSDTIVVIQRDKTELRFKIK